MEDLQFPTFDYYLDKSDPDVVILRRQDGSFVAAFSARGATKQGILEAAKEDRRELIQAHTDPLLGQEMVGFVYDTESRENDIGDSHQRGVERAQRAKELIALLVAVLILASVGVAYAATTYLAHYAAIHGRDHPGKDDTLLAEGVDGLLGRWQGDAEDPGEPPD